MSDHNEDVLVPSSKLDANTQLHSPPKTSSNQLVQDNHKMSGHNEDVFVPSSKLDVNIQLHSPTKTLLVQDDDDDGLWTNSQSKEPNTRLDNQIIEKSSSIDDGTPDFNGYEPTESPIFLASNSGDMIRSFHNTLAQMDDSTVNATLECNHNTDNPQVSGDTGGSVVPMEDEKYLQPNEESKSSLPVLPVACSRNIEHDSTATPNTSDSSAKLPTKSELRMALIDTTAPFESVTQAVSKFSGVVDWTSSSASHRIQTQELIEYKKKAEAAEEAKTKAINELDSAKRLIEELKLNLEKEQKEEQQAKQDSQLANLRTEELKKGIIGDDASVAAKTQLEVAKSRLATELSELKSVKEKLEALRKEHDSLVNEKEEAMKKAEEAVCASREVEMTVENLNNQRIATKGELESIHASHMEAEAHQIGVVMAIEQDAIDYEKELKQAEEELQRINQRILSAKDVNSKLHSASDLLADLKSELEAYMESKSKEEGSEIQAAIASARKEVKEVRINIEKANSEVNCLKAASASLQLELEKEQKCVSTIRQRERITSTAIDHDVTNPEIPKQLQQDADEAKLKAELAREEFRKAEEDAKRAKAGASTMETRLLATRSGIEAAKASEMFALGAMRALRENESFPNDATDLTTVSVEEYYELSKEAQEAEEQANQRVKDVIAEIELAKDRESETVKQLDEVNQELSATKEALSVAMDKAEKAKEGKLGAEQELIKWKNEYDDEQRGKGSSSSSSCQETSSPHPPLPADVMVTKKKKRSYFPRFLMFMSRRKSHSHSSKPC